MNLTDTDAAPAGYMPGANRGQEALLRSTKVPRGSESEPMSDQQTTRDRMRFAGFGSDAWEEDRARKTEQQPFVHELADRIAAHVFTRPYEAIERASLKNLLIDFAAEIKRSAIEP